MDPRRHVFELLESLPPSKVNHTLQSLQNHVYASSHSKPIEEFSTVSTTSSSVVELVLELRSWTKTRCDRNSDAIVVEMGEMYSKDDEFRTRLRRARAEERFLRDLDVATLDELAVKHDRIWLYVARLAGCSLIVIDESGLRAEYGDCDNSDDNSDDNSSTSTTWAAVALVGTSARLLTPGPVPRAEAQRCVVEACKARYPDVFADLHAARFADLRVVARMTGAQSSEFTRKDACVECILKCITYLGDVQKCTA